MSERERIRVLAAAVRPGDSLYPHGGHTVEHVTVAPDRRVILHYAPEDPAIVTASNPMRADRLVSVWRRRTVELDADLVVALREDIEDMVRDSRYDAGAGIAFLAATREVTS